jgi:Carboxypeptidase regulatory-like domain
MFVLSVALVRAQDTSSLTGTVHDPSGAIVAGAEVTVSNTERGIKRDTTSNASGEYSLSALPAPAAYSVTVTSAGFKKFVAKGVALDVAQKARIDVVLQVGASSIEVTVEGTAGARVETENSEMSGTVTGKEISQLQLNGRNFTQLVTLVPGISNQTGQDEGQVGIVGSVQYSMNGGRVEYNNWELDGGDNMDNGSNGSLNVFPSVDAIAEFKVLTSNYGAQYGRNGSGTVETELKSGTSAFHGNVYEFVRNDAFNAKNYFTSSVAPYKKNDYGFTIGGPVYIPGVYNKDKQKTFFFYSEEWRRDIVAGTVFNQPVPYSQERTGNFSGVCPDSTGSFANCPVEPALLNGAPNPLQGQYFPGNQVPVSPVGTALLPLIPVASAGNDNPGAALFLSSPTQPTTWREELFRIDHNLTEHNRLSFHYVHDSWDQVQSSTLWTGSSFPTVQTDFNGPAVSMLARLTTTISPTLLNEFVVSYTTDHLVMKSVGTPSATAWQLPTGGIPGLGFLFNNGFGGKLPAITVTGGTEYGSNGFFMDPAGEWPEGPYNSNPTYTYRDNVTKIVGKHSLAFGAYFVAAQKNELSSVFTDGQLSFDTSSSGTTGNPFADLLVGQIASYSQGSNQVKFYNRYKIVEPFFQDDWRVTPRLTLNLGLRVSLFGTYREKYGHAYNWDPAAYSASTAPIIDANGNLVPGSGNFYDGLVHCGASGVPVGCSKGHLFNPAPRIGFAYDPWGDGKTAIRGGYGIFFEHTNGNEANTESLEGQTSQLLQVASAPPPISGYQNIGGGGTGATGPLSFISIPNKTTWPYMQQWHFDIQRELPQHVVATISYVGSKGTHLTRQTDLNQVHPISGTNPYPVGQAIAPQTTGYIGDCAAGTVGPGGAAIPGYNVDGNPADQSGVGVNMFIACGNNADFFRPYYGIGRINRIETASSSNYNALEFSVLRTVGGLTLDFSYTYAHSIDDSSDKNDVGFVNTYDPAANRASSSFDVRHSLNFAYVYDVPFFRKSGITHTLLGGWQWSGIANYSTGTPFSVFNTTAPTDNAGVGNGVGSGSYADRIGNPKADLPPAPGQPQTAGYLYNPNAYTAPQGLTFGNSGRNSLRNPSRTNFDMALFKSFAVSESKHFEFRFEAFNVFNHTEWGAIYGDAGSGANNSSSGNNGYAGPYTGPGTTNQFQILQAHNARILQLGAKFIF